MTDVINLTGRKREDVLSEIQECLDKYKVGEKISEKEFLQIMHEAFIYWNADMRAIIQDLEHLKLKPSTLDDWIFCGRGAPEHFERPIVLDLVYKHLSKSAEAA